MNYDYVNIIHGTVHDCNSNLVTTKHDRGGQPLVAQ